MSNATARSCRRPRFAGAASVLALAVVGCGGDDPAADEQRARALLSDLDPATVVIERSDFREYRAPDDPPEVTVSLTADGELTVWDVDLGERRSMQVGEAEVAAALAGLWERAPERRDFLDDNEFVQHCIDGLTYLDPDGDAVQLNWDCGQPPGALTAALEVVADLRDGEAP